MTINDAVYFIVSSLQYNSGSFVTMDIVISDVMTHSTLSKARYSKKIRTKTGTTDQNPIKVEGSMGHSSIKKMIHSGIIRHLDEKGMYIQSMRLEKDGVVTRKTVIMNAKRG